MKPAIVTLIGGPKDGLVMTIDGDCPSIFLFGDTDPAENEAMACYSIECPVMNSNQQEASYTGMIRLLDLEPPISPLSP